MTDDGVMVILNLTNDIGVPPIGRDSIYAATLNDLGNRTSNNEYRWPDVM